MTPTALPGGFTLCFSGDLSHGTGVPGRWDVHLPVLLPLLCTPAAFPCCLPPTLQRSFLLYRNFLGHGPHHGISLAKGIRWCRGLWNAVQILGAGVPPTWPPTWPPPCPGRAPRSPPPTKGFPTVYGLKNNAGKAASSHWRSQQSGKRAFPVRGGDVRF